MARIRGGSRPARVGVRVPGVYQDLLLRERERVERSDTAADDRAKRGVGIFRRSRHLLDALEAGQPVTCRRHRSLAAVSRYQSICGRAAVRAPGGASRRMTLWGRRVRRPWTGRGPSAALRWHPRKTVEPVSQHVPICDFSAAVFVAFVRMQGNRIRGLCCR